MKKRAVVLLSGGIDSTTSLAIAGSRGYELYALSFDYSQRHRVEIQSAKKVAAAMNVKKHLIIKFNLQSIGGSALTADIEVPKSGFRGQGLGVSRKNKSSIPNPLSPIPVTYVPARNTIFLSFALGWAEVLIAENIYIGATAVDYSGYPDCRPEYLKAFEDMANLATKASVGGEMRFRINAPLISMSKAEIIKKGMELGVDYSLTWSCYDPQPAVAGARSSKLKVRSENRKGKAMSYEPRAFFVPCGRCDSCLYRAKGFKKAGVSDPLSG